jgi:hypothetical protein
VELSVSAVRELAAVLARGEAMAASPTMRLDLSGATWMVRAYYRLWQQMPYYRAGVIGSGVYALSPAGRARFDQFPDVFSEDEFVRLLMKPDERRMVDSCQFTVRAPRALADLIPVRARWLAANRQLLRLYPHLRVNERKRFGASLARIATMPSLWPCVPVFILVRVAAECVRAREALLGRRMRWTRDDSTRTEFMRTESTRTKSMRAESAGEEG